MTPLSLPEPRAEQTTALVADIRTLVECESPSLDEAAVARSADVVAALGEARLGQSAERIITEGCTHLRWRFGPPPTRVLVLCHHDTVWPLGSLKKRPFTVNDGVLQGPGCFDMKAGLAMAIHAVASPREEATMTDLASPAVTTTMLRAPMESAPLLRSSSMLWTPPPPLRPPPAFRCAK